MRRRRRNSCICTALQYTAIYMCTILQYMCTILQYMCTIYCNIYVYYTAIYVYYTAIYVHYILQCIIQWNLSIEGTLTEGHLSNEDTVGSPNHIELCTNLPLN